MEPADETRAYLEFLIPQSLAPQLPGFLRELEAQSRDLGISDIQLSLTSLEEVFLTIARKVCLQDFALLDMCTQPVCQQHSLQGIPNVFIALALPDQSTRVALHRGAAASDTLLDFFNCMLLTC